MKLLYHISKCEYCRDNAEYTYITTKEILFSGVKIHIVNLCEKHKLLITMNESPEMEIIDKWVK